MTRILAISDIHGERAMLEELLQKVNFTAEDKLILMGDYIDRGPDSRGVLNFVQQLQEKANATVLMGNHEALILNAFTSSDSKTFHHWLDLAGGDATLASYGLTPNDFDDSKLPLLSQLAKDSELYQHLQYIETMSYYVEEDDVVFVHAGLEPGLSAADTPIKQKLWIRDDFHKNYAGDKTVVFGHTSTFRLHEDKTNTDVFFGNNRIIGIDGGAAYGGQLHCLAWPSKKITSLQNPLHQLAE